MTNPFQPTPQYLATCQFFGNIRIPTHTAGIHWGAYLAAGGPARYIGKW